MWLVSNQCVSLVDVRYPLDIQWVDVYTLWPVMIPLKTTKKLLQWWATFSYTVLYIWFIMLCLVSSDARPSHACRHVLVGGVKLKLGAPYQQILKQWSSPTFQQGHQLQTEDREPAGSPLVTTRAHCRIFLFHLTHIHKWQNITGSATDSPTIADTHSD